MFSKSSKVRQNENPKWRTVLQFTADDIYIDASYNVKCHFFYEVKHSNLVQGQNYNIQNFPSNIEYRKR